MKKLIDALKQHQFAESLGGSGQRQIGAFEIATKMTIEALAWASKSEKKEQDPGKSDQYQFRLSLFSKENQTIEKFIGTNNVRGIVAEILKADRASKYEIVELFVKKLTPRSRRLR